MLEKTKADRSAKKALSLERAKLRLANEMKNSSYQIIDPIKMKHMNKKQLRSIKKTTVNKDGQVISSHMYIFALFTFYYHDPISNEGRAGESLGFGPKESQQRREKTEAQMIAPIVSIDFLLIKTL
jgi:hypothetical protein